MIETTPASRGPRATLFAAMLLTAALLAACSSDDSGSDATPPPGAETLTVLTADGSSVRLHAEIAETPEQRAQGLMARTELAPDSGMLFSIDPPGRGFWMKDTTLALTVAFIGKCGEILHLADLEPLSEEVKNTDRPYIFALEMAQGWFKENGVAVGDVLQLPKRFLAQDC